MKKILLLMAFVLMQVFSARVNAISLKPFINSLERKILKEVENNMVTVAGGNFDMGDKNPSADPGSLPVHKVSVSSFMISKYDVTERLWKAIMGNTPDGVEKCDNCPVARVSWNDAQAFISKLNSLTGKHYRLPTEAEWEYAAEGGSITKGYTFSGSNDIDSAGWDESNSSKTIHPAGLKEANELGLYDMTGNVLQWCNDWYNIDYYKVSPVQNPRGPDTGETKVLHGCAWNVFTRYCGVAVRADLFPNGRYNNVGFRLARNL